MSDAMRRRAASAHQKGRKRWNGGEPTTTSRNRKHGNTLEFTMTVTGTGTRMTMTTDVVSTPTTIAVPPSGSGDTTFVVVMPTDGSGDVTDSAASATGGSSNETALTMTFGSDVFTFNDGATSNGTVMTMTIGSDVVTLTNGGSLPTGISGLSSMLAAQSSSIVSPAAASTVTQNVAVLTIAAGSPDSAAQSAGYGDNGSSGTHTAAIVGATLGAAAFLIGLVAAVLAVLALLRRRSKREKELLAAVTANQYAQSQRDSHYPQTDAGNRQSQYPGTDGPRSRPASPN